MRMPFRKLAAGVLAVCALGGSAGPSARADFLSNDVGNTQMSEGAPQGVVSFLVFKNTGSNFVDAINSALKLTGTKALSASTLSGGGSIDFSAPYVYLYQVVNFKANNSNKIDSLQVKNPGAFTSAGYFANQAAAEDPYPGGVVGTKPNNVLNKGLGTDPTKDDTIDGTPSVKGVTGFRLASYDNAINPSSVDLTGSTNSGFITFSFPSIHGSPGNRPSDTSTLVFLTSKYAPQYLEGRVGSGDSTSNGDIPSAVTPEPGTLVLCGVAVFCLAGAYVRRRKSLAATVAA
jgi:hypothetical protein